MPNNQCLEIARLLLKVPLRGGCSSYHAWTEAEKQVVREQYAHNWASKVELASKLGPHPSASAAW